MLSWLLQEFEISALDRETSPKPSILLLSNMFQISGSIVNLFAFASSGLSRVLFISYGT